MKYKPSKREPEPLKVGEQYYSIRYEYSGQKYIVILGAKSSTEVREKFIPLHSDGCVIHDVRLKQ